MRRLLLAFPALLLALLLGATPAYACGGLIGPNGAVLLTRTTTFAGYHDGVEHYVTAFSYAGGGGAFGSLTPLPGVPSDVERGGDWTLQRLVRETTPLRLDSFAIRGTAAPAAAPAEVLLQKRIDALDITVLKGGGAAVGDWAKEHGFRLPPDAPEVLDFYAKRSPIFLAAVFDAEAAAKRGQSIGDGTPVHITIPTPNPWVPLRILGLGKLSGERVDADVFLLTDQRPALLPVADRSRGLLLEHDAAATASLLADLRADKGMAWIPQSGWLTKLRVDASASQLRYDLAIDASGQNAPSRVAAGFDPAFAPLVPDDMGWIWPLALSGGYVVAGIALLVVRRRIAVTA
ncbi:MAG TPA: DUF2330 domain-containing protein [Candidatus Dormibacteraeota bacterium]|jgi:hypothetical protein|nr:DUF2330 domain-containing protein [Candidatus Dormibacteraeota bacterium]